MAFLKLIPATKDYLWGGTRLKDQYNKKSDKKIIAETWELSCHKDGLSKIEGLDMTLAQYISLKPESTGYNCINFEYFPVLVKLIDAAHDLSIQVHPNDDYATKHEHQWGKTEVWYIVDKTPGAYIYYGLEKKITREELKSAIQNNTLCEHLHKVYVKKGDVFFIEAGTIHAVGAGCLIAEVQQNSNITYRMYDYNRVDAHGNLRELHIEKACDVAIRDPARKKHNFGSHIAKSSYFTIDKLSIDNNCIVCKADEASFQHLLFLNGEAKIKIYDSIISARKGDSYFVEAGSGVYSIKGKADILMTYVDKQKYRIGIDLGGTNIKAGVIDENNQILATYTCKTQVERPWKEIVYDMANAAHKAVEKAGILLEECVLIGVGCPGTVDAESQIVIYSNNFPNWEYIPVGKTLEKIIGIPVKINNDANCAALGEYVAGAAKDEESAILFTLGTGVGGGVVFNGKIFEGGVGGAELGHTILVQNGNPCTCGRNGCMETYCSATALICAAKLAAENNPQSLLNQLCEGNIKKMDGVIPFKAAKLGDETAINVVAQYVEYLGDGIVNIVNIFRPKVVLLSGGICGEGTYLTDPLNSFVEKNSFGGARIFIPKVKVAALGNNAGIVGAANL